MKKVKAIKIKTNLPLNVLKVVIERIIGDVTKEPISIEFIHREKLYLVKLRESVQMEKVEKTYSRVGEIAEFIYCDENNDNKSNKSEHITKSNKALITIVLFVGSISLFLTILYIRFRDNSLALLKG